MKRHPRSGTRRLFAALIVTLLVPSLPVRGDDAALRQAVLTSISRARKFLVSRQRGDGSWTMADDDRYPDGITSLVLLSLLNAGATVDDPAVSRGLRYLRNLPAGKPDKVYESALAIMVLALADQGGRDLVMIERLARDLETSQTKVGESAGLWAYDSGRSGGGGGDRSNGQYAILGLYEAANAGVAIDRMVWLRAQQHWMQQQRSDGGWNYSDGGRKPSSGSMTVAGLSTLAITNEMLRDERELKSLDCCQDTPPDDAIKKGIAWMEQNFQVGRNPADSNWWLYYLYGMERAGRLNGIRFFGEHDWYRAGARRLVDSQSIQGTWKGAGQTPERDETVGTALALLFLSKGLSPVLINKLKYGFPDLATRDDVLGRDWNKHPRDVRSLTDHISTLEKWPKLLTSQTVNIRRLNQTTGVDELRQAPILSITGSEKPDFDEQQRALLRDYIDQGGFVFAVNNCRSRDFDSGFRELIPQLFPDGDGVLKRLPADHPVYRSEYLFEDPEAIELWGVDFGCRTSIIYSPDDLSCFWNKWTRYPVRGRSPAVQLQMTKALRIGVNVVAYATGREPPSKLDVTPGEQDGRLERIDRGLLRIAKLRHDGGWDTAPRALRNLLMALNQTVGTTASTSQENLTPLDPNLFSYPLLYLHGRFSFNLNDEECAQLREYVAVGHVIFADACCGSERFDASFRDLMQKVFPDQPLQRIPVEHELFRSDFGHDVRRVKRRVPAVGGGNLEARTEEGPPFLEGIEIDGRYAVIYSKYDISCALEKQSNLACVGYASEDAVKLAVNIVLYSMLQDISLRESANP